MRDEEKTGDHGRLVSSNGCGADYFRDEGGSPQSGSFLL
jgi:hypothetical protein